MADVGALRARGLQRRNQILSAAFEVFATKGYGGPQLEDVAERAGIAKEIVALCFNSKEALFRAVLRSLLHF